MTIPITSLGVVLPVHNEELLLPRCLAALDRARAAVIVPVHVVVVLDSCTDASAEIARTTAAPDTDLVAVEARNVGAARAAGVAVLLERPDAESTWIASTDADSAVGPNWLSGHLGYAEQGFDAVAGTVVIDDWHRHPATRQRAYQHAYQHRWGHRHVHGANLGVSASAYRAVQGFPALPTGEDVALVAALAAAGHRIAWASDLPVLTSGRLHGRAPQGMSSHLRTLTRGAPEACAPTG